MMLGARTGAWSGKPLPYLRRVAYLESHGNEWIDTGFFATSQTKVECDFIVTSASSMYGVYGAYDNKKRFIFYQYDQKTYEFGYGGWQRFELDYNNKYHVLQDGNKLYIDGELKASISSTSEWVSSITSELFCFKYKHSNYKPMVGKIWSAKFYDNQTLYRDFIPVLDISGRPCMYNQAPLAVPSDDPSRFFYNQGTGEFTWGELET